MDALAVLGVLATMSAGVSSPLVGAAMIAALVLSHLRREVEGNYRQGARDRTGMPVDVPRILRSRRVIGRDVVAALGALGVATAVAALLVFLLVPHVALRIVGFDTRLRPF